MYISAAYGNGSTTPAPFIPVRNALKAVLIITLFFATFLAGIAAFFLKELVVQRQNSSVFKNTFSLISVFGAGVFLGTCLLDLLPESLECFEKSEDIAKYFNGFPVPELCIAIGFLMVLSLEQSILYANERRWVGNSELNHLLSGEETTNTTQQPTSYNNTEEYTETANNTNAAEEDNSAETENALLEVNSGGTEELNSHSHSYMRSLLLVFALSLHAVFEGVSLGMISDVSVLLQVFFALLIHKTIIGFSLGIRLVQSKLETTTSVLCCVIFAGQVIIGGFLGMAIINAVNKTSKTASAFMSGILQGIACGTFLYITCFEILPHELNHATNRPLKMLFLLLGFALISIFVAVFPS